MDGRTPLALPGADQQGGPTLSFCLPFCFLLWLLLILESALSGPRSHVLTSEENRKVLVSSAWLRVQPERGTLLLEMFFSTLSSELVTHQDPS